MKWNEPGMRGVRKEEEFTAADEARKKKFFPNPVLINRGAFNTRSRFSTAGGWVGAGWGRGYINFLLSSATPGSAPMSKENNP